MVSRYVRLSLALQISAFAIPIAAQTQLLLGEFMIVFASAPGQKIEPSLITHQVYEKDITQQIPAFFWKNFPLENSNYGFQRGPLFPGMGEQLQEPQLMINEGDYENQGNLEEWIEDYRELAEGTIENDLEIQPAHNEEAQNSPDVGVMSYKDWTDDGQVPKVSYIEQLIQKMEKALSKQGPLPAPKCVKVPAPIGAFSGPSKIYALWPNLPVDERIPRQVPIFYWFNPVIEFFNGPNCEGEVIYELRPRKGYQAGDLIPIEGAFSFRVTTASLQDLKDKYIDYITYG